jgi:hypothetical protein
MPPKRALTNANADTNDYQSPPPGLRNAQGIEHHHSSMPGHHPETPAGAPVAIATPPRSNIRDENLEITGGHSPVRIQDQTVGAASTIRLPETGDANGMICTMATTAVVQGSPQAVIEPVAAIGGGARAAYQASQQQRIITCNLNSIPISE